MTGYQIIDEPRPGTLTHLVVQPIWPLFGLMFGGFWLALPWFTFNGFAMGCPARWKTLAWALAGPVVAAILLYALAFASHLMNLPDEAAPYLRLLLLLWKLGLGYALFVMQQRSFEIYQHYGGGVRNGFIVILLAFMLEGRILGHLVAWSPFLGAILQ